MSLSQVLTILIILLDSLHGCESKVFDNIVSGSDKVRKYKGVRYILDKPANLL